MIDPHRKYLKPKPHRSTDARCFAPAVDDLGPDPLLIALTRVHPELAPVPVLRKLMDEGLVHVARPRPKVERDAP